MRSYVAMCWLSCYVVCVCACVCVCVCGVARTEGCHGSDADDDQNCPEKHLPRLVRLIAELAAQRTVNRCNSLGKTGDKRPKIVPDHDLGETVTMERLHSCCKPQCTA